MRILLRLGVVLLSLASMNAAASSAVTYPNGAGGGDPHWKAPVSNFAALPASGNTIGDTRTELSFFGQYVWNGSSWQSPSGAFSVASSNGFAGSFSAGVLTISSTVNGMAKGNGTALSTGVAGTDYSAGTAALATGILKNTTTTGALSIAASGTDYQAPIPNSTAGANQFCTGFTAPSTFTYAQPGFSNLSGSATAAQMLALASGDFYVGNGSNQPAAVAMSGDATLANTGAVTIASNAVTNAKAAQMAANTIKGNNTGSTANAADLTIAQVVTMITTSLNALYCQLAGCTMTGAIITPNGTAAAVALAVGATGTGLFAPSAGILGFSSSGTERARMDASGHTTWGSTTSGSAQLNIQNTVDSTIGGLRLTCFAASSNCNWDAWSQDSGNLDFNNNNQGVRYVMGVGGGFGISTTGTAAQAALEIEGTSTNTLISSISLIAGNVQNYLASITNSNTTAGNLSALVFGTDSSKWDSGIIGVHSTHGASYAGYISFYTSTAGLAAEAFRLLANGTSKFFGALDMGTNQIHNVVDPSSAQDAATQNYVLSKVGSAGAPVIQVKSTNYTALITDNEIWAEASIVITIPDCTGLANNWSWYILNDTSDGSITNILLSGSNVFAASAGGGATYQLSEPGAWVKMTCITTSGTVRVYQ